MIRGVASSSSTVGLFVASALLYIAYHKNKKRKTQQQRGESHDYEQRQQSRENGHHHHDCASNGHHATTADLFLKTPKGEVHAMRKKHFSNKLSVSYSNTGGLMFVWVGIRKKKTLCACL